MKSEVSQTTHKNLSIVMYGTVVVEERDGSCLLPSSRPSVKPMATSQKVCNYVELSVDPSFSKSSNERCRPCGAKEQIRLLSAPSSSRSCFLLFDKNDELVV